MSATIPGIGPAVAEALSTVPREELIEIVLEQRDEIDILNGALDLLKEQSPLVAWLTTGRTMVPVAFWLAGMAAGILATLAVVWGIS